MNQRNLLYIYPNNHRKHFPISDNKLLAKKTLAAAGVPVPDTYRTYGSFYELRTMAEDLRGFPPFVIKPAQGSGGGGIVVVAGRDGDDWLSAGGKRFTVSDLRGHISDILFGIHSFGLSDCAVIEQKVEQHPVMAELSPGGLADVRVILFKGKPAMAMTRIPTRSSDGKANLHQGAVGAGIDLKTGRTVQAILGGRPAMEHPDTGLALIGRQVPFWPEVLRVARRTAAAVPLGYIGADIVLSPQGPLVLEINVRPGLQIQNANGRGMRQVLEALGGMHTEWDEEP